MFRLLKQKMIHSNHTKKILRAIGLMLMGLVIYNVGNSFLFDLNFSDISVESLKQRFSDVHFVGGGNDFGGAIFWLDTQRLITGQVITQGSETRTCFTRVRGIYYNNQRGLRLWPLDAVSLNMLKATGSGYDNLSITGGFYRDCSSSAGNTGEIYSIYGYITYTRSGNSSSNPSAGVSYLAAGVKLNLTGNSMIPGLADNFQYFNNITPLGYFYDSNGGIGFVGGELSGHDNLISFLNTSGNSINDAFQIAGVTIVSTDTGRALINLSGLNTAQETLWKLLIQGSIGVSKSTDSSLTLSLLGNPQKKTIVLGGTEINSSTILNLAKQNAQNLCRGKVILTTDARPFSNTSPILCYKNTNLTIHLADDAGKYKGKTIIMESGNIYLDQTMMPTEDPIEIFLNKGVLFIKNNGEPYLTDFNKDWYPVLGTSINRGMYLKGNLIINGLLIGGDPGGATSFDHKLHIEGKIVSFNSIKEPSQGRSDQVDALLGSGYRPRINLENTFVWYCGFNGSGSDGTNCSTGGVISLVPLVILNGNFPGNLLK